MFVVNRSVVAFAQSALRCTEFSYVLFGLNAPDKLLLNSFTPSPAPLARSLTRLARSPARARRPARPRSTQRRDGLF